MHGGEEVFEAIDEGALTQCQHRAEAAAFEGHAQHRLPSSMRGFSATPFHKS